VSDGCFPFFPISPRFCFALAIRAPSIVASRLSSFRTINSLSPPRLPPLSCFQKMTTSSPSSSSSGKKSTLLSLPISPLAPIYHLPPDPLFPTPTALFDLSSYEPPEDLAENGPVALKIGDPVPPSMLRRSRQVRMGGTFTYTSPRKSMFISLSFASLCPSKAESRGDRFISSNSIPL